MVAAATPSRFLVLGTGRGRAEVSSGQTRGATRSPLLWWIDLVRLTGARQAALPLLHFRKTRGESKIKNSWVEIKVGN